MTHSTLNNTKEKPVLVPIDYKVEWSQGKFTKSLDVSGFAFETPGWPWFHACVRYGNRYGDSLFEDWVIDHYETGLAITLPKCLECKEDAPDALRRYLNTLGKKHVRKVLGKYLP
jgi:hypothetical protein